MEVIRRGGGRERAGEEDVKLRGGLARKGLKVRLGDPLGAGKGGIM